MSEHRLDRIVIERPRSGMRMSSRRIKGHKKELDRITVEATVDGFLQPYLIKTRNRTKYFSDHLAPLRRWLRSRVGQPWDVVYSELCRKLDITTLSGQHILSHVWDFVERHVVILDDVPYKKDRQDYRLTGWRDRFYVHPETSILCLVPRIKKTEPQSCIEIVQIDSHHQYRKLNSVWYFVTFESVPHKGKVTDILLRKPVDRDTAHREYDSAIYACHKRHATKKEIKKIEQQRNRKARN